MRGPHGSGVTAVQSFEKISKIFKIRKFFTFFGKLSLETMIFGIKNNFWNFSDFFFSKLVIRISVPDICSSKNKDWNIEKLIWVCYTNFSFWSKIISTISYNFHYKFDFQVIIYQKNQVLDLFLAIGSDLMTSEVIRAKMQIWPHVQILVTNSETPFPALLGSYAKYILRINCVFWNSNNLWSEWKVGITNSN